MTKVDEQGQVSSDGQRWVTVDEDGVSMARPVSLAEQVEFLSDDIADQVLRGVPLARSVEFDLAGGDDVVVLTLRLSSVPAKDAAEKPKPAASPAPPTRHEKQQHAAKSSK